ncbi:MAG: VOC family protein [Nitrososphaerales archaeon]
MEIPAHDVKRSAEFYQAVFTWKVTEDPEDPGFADGSGHVIGHWVNKLQVVGEADVIPYIYVSKVKDTVERIRSNGCEVVKAPYREGGLWVARFRDPAGNVIGIWQHGPLGLVPIFPKRTQSCHSFESGYTWI